MKTRLTIVVMVLVCIIIMGFENSFVGQDEVYKTEAIYTGITDEGQFEFLDDEDENIYFDKVIDDIKLDLYDDENIDKMFSISWTEEGIMLLNESEEPTGKTRIYKTIIKLKAL